MNPFFKCSRLLPLLAAVSVAGSGRTRAGVLINPDGDARHSGEPVASIELRASPASWDQAISSSAKPHKGIAVRANLGSMFHGPGREFWFTLEHRAGEGLIHTLEEEGKPPSSVAWGTFNQPPPGAKILPASTHGSPGTPFHFLTIEAISQRPDSFVEFSSLDFTAPALPKPDGYFFSGRVTKDSVFRNAGRGTAIQRLVSDTSLAEANWILRGRVRVVRSLPATGGDESVRFLIKALMNPDSGQTGPRGGRGRAANRSPEPGAAALGILTAALFMLRRRRKL